MHVPIQWSLPAHRRLLAGNVLLFDRCTCVHHDGSLGHRPPLRATSVLFGDDEEPGAEMQWQRPVQCPDNPGMHLPLQ